VFVPSAVIGKDKAATPALPLDTRIATDQTTSSFICTYKLRLILEITKLVAVGVYEFHVPIAFMSAAVNTSPLLKSPNAVIVSS
jgi:hypothetical protein